jgi:hypothetical protein
MKKYFSISALFILFSFFKVSAQNCIPYAPVTVGYYPPSGNLPCAYNNAYFDVTISYKGHSSSIYTAYVDSITNLPLGLSASYPTNSLVPGGTWCAKISGTPVDNCGQYKILIYISIPQVGVSGELTALSNANPGFFFANQGDNDNRIIRLINNSCQPLVLPQNSPFLSTSCGINCANNSTITPQSNSLATGNTATFAATTSDPNPSYVWQSNLGQGFQTLNNYGNYSGANSATLSITNVQLPNHTQPIRVITTSGNCIDTSNVAVINILDTCIVTVYDTLLTTVTDTLVINTQITGINPPNNLNTLKVFPNPASTHITIDYGNFNAMSGYTLTIINSVGQTVFTTPINQQTSYIDLSTWTGNGIYFVQLIDPQNNTIENRKIVIQ